MKNLIFYCCCILLLLPGFSLGQSQRNELLKHRTYKVYFGQNFIESLSFNKAQVANILGTGNYRYVAIFGSSAIINSTLANEMHTALINNNTNNLNQEYYPSIKEFNQGSSEFYSTFFAHRHLDFPGSFFHVAIKNLNTQAWFVAAIEHNPYLYQETYHYSFTGERLAIDADRLNVSPGHQFVNALSYFTTAPSFSPTPSYQAVNHANYNTFGGGVISAAGSSNYLNIPYSGNTSTAISLASSQILSNSNNVREVKLNFTGGGGKYEVFVDDPSFNENIYLPITGDPNKNLPYWRYLASDSRGEASLTVKVASNKSTKIRVRSAYDYDNYPGLGNKSYDFLEWVYDQNFINTYRAFCNNSSYYTEFTISSTGVITQGGGGCSVNDGDILGTWNINIPNHIGYPQLKARTLNGQLWVTQVIPTNNPNVPEGYGKADAFVVRGKNMLLRGDVSNVFNASAIQACFAGENTNYGGLAIPAAANVFSPIPAGYIPAVSSDGTPYYYKNATGPCGVISDGTVLGTWNINIPNHPTYPQLKARFLNGHYWVTQVIPTNIPSIPEGYGKADAFVVRGKNMLLRSDITNNFNPYDLQACFWGENTNYGGLAIPAAANVFSPLPAGYIAAVSGDGTPYYYKNSAKTSPESLLNQPGNQDITLYPNPALEYVNVLLAENTGEEVEIEVMSLQGKILKSYSTHETQMSIPVTELASGSYFMRIKSANEWITKKFTKL